ncbi:MAG: AAA family ATPase [Thermoplasmatota archaeon]
MQRKMSYILTGLIVLLVALSLALPISTAIDGQVDVRADGTAFEENFDVYHTPDDPKDNDTVRVVLSSTSSENISEAYLLISYKPEDDDDFGQEGAVSDDYQFIYAEDHKTMVGRIPDYYNQGGVTVRYWIEATLESGEQFASSNYTYSVAKTGSWVSEDFEDNLELEYSPEVPSADQNVTVTLSQKHENIAMNWASLKAVFDQPDGPTVSGGQAFQEKEDSRWQVDIPGYPENTTVLFYVEAYDMYGDVITSRNYSYNVGGQTEYVTPLVVVFDEFNDEYIDGANVTILNNTGIVFEGQTKDGKVDVDEQLYPGSYVFSVDHKGDKKSRNVTLTGGESGSSATFRFDFKSKSALSHGMSEFPQNILIFGILAGIFLPLLTFWTVYQEKQNIKMALTKKKAYKNDVNGDGWLHRFREILINETIDPEYLVPVGLFLLSLVGLSFIPFYPWWMVLTFSLVVGAVAYKYPYNSLIILTLLVTGAAAYQSPEFGLVFLLFSLLVLMASFFDWKFGFLVFAIVFLARFGPVFLIPVMSAVLFSTYLALITTACAGLFIVLTSSSGSIEIFGLVPSSPHQTSFMLFTKDIVNDFNPSSLGEAFSSISSANPEIIMTILSDNFGASILPFIQILIWCMGVYLISSIIRAREPRLESLKEWLMYPMKKNWRYSIGGTLLLGLSPLVGLIYFGYLGDMSTPSLLLTVVIIAASLVLVFVSQGVASITKGLFREYYRNKLGITDVGTRIAEMTDLGETTFDDIGGLDDVKEEVKESILIPLLRPDISQQFGVETSKGVLLFGPIGCGKTMLMKSLATELDVEMINVKCGDIMSRWYGESEDKIMKLFEVARKRKPCIIFFDEVDTIAKKRDMYATDDVTPRLLSLLLSELDGMDRAEGIIIVGSTNKPEMMDPALLRPGRFDKIIYIPTPDKESRKEILSIHLRDKPLSKDVELDKIARRTEGFSGADMANLAKEAATMAMKKALDSGKMRPIDMKIFNDILKHMTPSITPSMKEEYERTRKKYERKIHEFKRPEVDRGTILSEIPDLKEQKEIFKKRVLYPLTESEMVDKFNISGAKSVLFYGPKGCGKIELIKAALNEFGLPMRVVSARELKDVIHEEGRGVIKMLFNEMRDMAPAVITITGLEDIAGSGGSKLGATDELAFSSLLHLIEDVKMAKDITLVATSHDPSDIDEELFERGRIEKTIYIPHPDIKRRYQLFKKELGDIPTSDDIDMKKFAKMTKGYTSEDIKSAVEEAKINAVTADKRKEAIVDNQLMIEAIEDTKPSLREDMVGSCERFSEEREK